VLPPGTIPETAAAIDAGNALVEKAPFRHLATSSSSELESLVLGAR
jgi:hypothetical protein